MTSEVLEEIYYNPSNPGSFAGVEPLYRSAKPFGISKSDVKDWLSEQFVYSLHKPARKRWKRNRVIVSHINEQFQADLVDMREFAGVNRNYKYILTVIDVFSKYAWALALKTKLSTEVRDAFKKIFQERRPSVLQTDQGKEFNNQILRNWLKQNEIHYFTSKNTDIKCSVIERFNRTLKGRMFRYFTKTGSRRYINVLNDLLEAYNNSYHRTIRMSPSKVNYNNEKLVFKNIYGVSSVRDILKSKLKKHEFKVGDKVRRKYTLNLLDRSYYPNWSDRIYNIDQRLRGDRKNLYKVDNRRLYPEEIQKIKGDYYRVEKILKKRKRNGRTELLVKWLNHPSSENSWVPEENVFPI